MKTAQWYKGNIHTHTTESDGDLEPEKVVSWYRRHGYDFLVLSDHNHLTLLDYGSKKRRFKRPLMIPGEEISANIQNGTIPIHINGIGISRVVEPIDTGQIVSTIQANVDAIHQAGGISSINHPNYKWAFDHTHLNKVKGLDLLEIFNGHPATNVYGGPGKYSYDQIWDGILSEGSVVFGVATDDAHNYHDFVPGKSNPGRGWVVVRAVEFTQEAIVGALETGEFYASTGVSLADLEATPAVPPSREVSTPHLRVRSIATRSPDKVHPTRCAPPRSAACSPSTPGPQPPPSVECLRVPPTGSPHPHTIPRTAWPPPRYPPSSVSQSTVLPAPLLLSATTPPEVPPAAPRSN